MPQWYNIQRDLGGQHMHVNVNTYACTSGCFPIVNTVTSYLCFVHLDHISSIYSIVNEHWLNNSQCIPHINNHTSVQPNAHWKSSVKVLDKITLKKKDSGLTYCSDLFFFISRLKKKSCCDRAGQSCPTWLPQSVDTVLPTAQPTQSYSFFTS